MADKTPLELDIEHLERYRTPVRVKTMIIFLILCLCFVALYSVKLKKELMEIEQETVVMKAEFSKEKVELLRQIKHLQAMRHSSVPDLNFRSDVLHNNSEADL